MNIVDTMVKAQSSKMRQHVPERPSMRDLELGVDLIMATGLVALNDIINNDEDPGNRIKAVSSATNIARYLEARKQVERDSKEINIAFNDPVFSLGEGGADGDD